MVSVFSNIKQNKPTQNLPIKDVLTHIRVGKYKREVEHYRFLRDEKGKEDPETEAAKKAMPYFTGSGTFAPVRNNNSLENHSGFIILDIDNTTEPKQVICEDPYTAFCFVSISGTGLAVGVRIDPDYHQQSFEALARYYLENFGVTVDRTADVARARFFSYDPLCFINWDSELFELDNFYTSVPTPSQEYTPLQTDHNKGIVCQKLDICINILHERHKIKFEQGSRNNFCYRLGRMLNRMDLSYTQVSECLPDDIRAYLEGESDNPIMNGMSQKPEEKGVLEPIERRALKANNLMAEEKPKQSTKKFYVMQEALAYLNANHEIIKNEVTQVVEVDGQAMTPFINNQLYIDLHEHRINISKEDLGTLINSNRFPIYHPFREYFENLPAIDPNKGSYIYELVQTITQETYPADFFYTMFRKWLVGVVAGCYDENINEIELVIAGEKNNGKTEFFRRLIPDKLRLYYQEGLDKNDRDMKVQICSNLIVLDDEYKGHDKKDIDKYKALMSCKWIDTIMKYDKYPTRMRRYASFCGTTNSRDVLKDDTGNRRVFVFWMNERDFDRFDKLPKDRVWAEAYYLFRQGLDFKVRAEDIRTMQLYNREFNLVNLEQELVAKWLIPDDEPTGLIEVSPRWITVSDIALYIQAQERTIRCDINKVRAALKQMQIPYKRSKQGVVYKVRLRSQVFVREGVYNLVPPIGGEK